MGRKTYKLVHFLDAARVVLGNKQAFGKDLHKYSQLLVELQKDWDNRYSVRGVQLRTEFDVGEHVMVKPAKLDGPRRGIIVDVNGSVGDRRYSVFLYDEGHFEDIEECLVSLLSQELKQRIEPRCVLVRLPGIVPGRIVSDLVKKATQGDAESDAIMTQDSEWSNKANRLVREWLEHPQQRYLGIIVVKTNEDCSVYGDIYRKLKPQAFDLEDDDSISEAGVGSQNGDASERPKHKEKQILSEYIKAQNFGMCNVELVESQLKVRTVIPSATQDENKEAMTKENLASQSKSSGGSVKSDDSAGSGSHFRGRMSGASRGGRPMAVNGNISNQFINSEVGSTTDNQPQPEDAKENGLITSDNVLEVKAGPSSVVTITTTASISSSSSSEEFPKPRLVNTGKDQFGELNINFPGRMLVRGHTVRPPYTRIEEFMLPEPIARSLTMAMHIEPSPLHKIAAPNFKRGSDLFVVAPDGKSQSGKNLRALSYLLPILRFLYDTYSTMTTVPDDAPPETLIIVNSFNTGKNLEAFITSLLCYCQEVPVRVKFLQNDTVPKHQNYNKRMIPGGNAILIMTMSHLDAVLNTKDGPFLFEKLRFLMFEELDLYLHSFREEILRFVTAARENVHISSRSVPVQVTFSGGKWTKEIEKLYKEVEHDRPPVVIINSPSQVLRYAQIPWKVHVVPKTDEETRAQALIDLLNSETAEVKTHSRIIIACSTSEVATKVYGMTDVHKDVEAHLVTGSIDVTELERIKSLWARKCPNLLVISDDMLNEADIWDATCLIHFDSPRRKPGSSFGATERFACLWTNMRHIELENPKGTATNLEQSQKLVAHFLLTGEEPNFFHLYKFGSTLDNTEFPTVLKERALYMETIGRKEIPLCEGVALFGFCNYNDPSACQARHVFARSEFWETPATPLTGELEVRIISCENPSLYKVELLRHYEYQDKKRICNISYFAEANRRKKELIKYYSNFSTAEEKDAIRLQSFREGTWCGVKVRTIDEEYYARARVERVLQKDKFGNPSTVRVYCIDSGTILNPAVEHMFELPLEYEQWSPLVINLILCNLKPKRGELVYRETDEKLARRITNEKILNAKIWLSLGNTVWVNPMVEYHLDPATRQTYKGDSTRLIMINEQLAEFNGTHLEALMELVNRYPGLYQGITSAEIKKGSDQSDELDMMKNEMHQPGDPIHWAFINKSDGGRFDPARIVTQYGYNPWTFFGVQEKYYDQFKSLEKELHSRIEEYANGRYKNCRGVLKNYYETGMVVAAKERGDGAWMRGLITRKYDGEEDADGDTIPEFEVFFVDYGDTCTNMIANELFPIPRILVTKLPFQAIAFKLEHVSPLDGEDWGQAAKDAFLDSILLNELSVDLEVVAFSDVDQQEAEYPLSCRFYNAVAYYEATELGASLVELGASLVEQGLVAWTPGKENLEQVYKDQLLNFYNTSVDQAMEVDNDSEEDEHSGQNAFDELGEFDVHFDGNLEEIGFKPVNGVKLPVVSFLESSERERGSRQLMAPELDIAAITESPPSASTSQTPVRSGSTSQASPSASSPASVRPPPLKTGLLLLHPRVVWRQTDFLFIITIQLPDIKEYDLELKDDKCTIRFQTLDKSPNYGFTIKAFGKLESQFDIHLTGQYLQVKFRKRMGGVKWLRPLFDKKEKYQWFKEDLDYLEGDFEDKDIPLSWANDVDEFKEIAANNRLFDSLCDESEEEMEAIDVTEDADDLLFSDLSDSDDEE